MEHAREIHIRRNATGNTRRSLNTAIHRWINSKRPESNLLDRFIELRIALEALYLREASGEMRFRLATYGAWHLGGDPDERRGYHRTLRKTYSVASTAVHAGEIENRPEKPGVARGRAGGLPPGDSQAPRGDRRTRLERVDIGMRIRLVCRGRFPSHRSGSH